MSSTNLVALAHLPGRWIDKVHTRRPPRIILRPGQPLRLEAAHLAGRGGRPGDRRVANDPTHRRIAAQPIGVIHILVASEASEHRLAQQADQ
jgi:hypothetical protein